MREEIEARLRGIARRAGLGGASPAVVAAVLTLLGAAVVVAMWRWWPRGDVGASASVRAEQGGPATASTSAHGSQLSRPVSVEASRTAGVFVHVVGEVRRPGVYELLAGSRVEAAVDAAGGATSDADLTAVNLAARAVDGQQVSVPTKADAPSVGQSKGATSGSPSSGAAGGASAGPVNINTADATLLDTLPGVGPSTAAKIVADRESNGPYASAEDLGRVPGIGPKKLEQLKPLITAQ